LSFLPLLSAQGDDLILQKWVIFTENSQKGMTKLHDGGQLRHSDFNSSFQGVKGLQRTKVTLKESEPLFLYLKKQNRNGGWKAFFRSDGSPVVKVELPVMSPAAESTAPDDHLEVYSVEKEEQHSGSETEPSR
jgi:hypothetical protein